MTEQEQERAARVYGALELCVSQLRLLREAGSAAWAPHSTDNAIEVGEKALASTPENPPLAQ